MRIRVLGDVEVIDGKGTVLPVSGMRRRLLAVLSVHAGEPVSTDRLVDALWPQAPPVGAVASLHAHVSRLRATLRSAGAAGVAVPELVTTPAGYVLQVGADQLDAARFERMVEQAGAEPDPRAAADGLDAALALWCGAPYGEFADEPFAGAEAARLTELRLGAVEQRAERLLALGRHAELVASLRRFTAEHPLRERAHAALMLALYRCGRQADALAAYRDLRRRLVTELGIEPSATLVRLEADLLAQLPNLDGPPARHVSRVPESVSSFLGRDNDLAAVRDSLRSARLVTLTGVGGVGKTRLALTVA
ncbi:MAG: AfsR/SARP family transcriptional regulator, partial [Actinomycetia bacterium]|nr:AfsR/SARP family transcriptional regulator [Actinomycetes bacterium]